ncbi:HIRAN domain-containing protein [Clostridioides sp. ZZV14-6044]|uniref:HIRAN domain-containing protein n=1 Tax=unclassified Clostridioides TaxID=2635829 RepID=UPI001D128A4C|nr:HIRAN domain-containing protein [Clostridioides sp. ZZV14-6104]MCC0728635.1 HIRAN domain-containing protein [Clostridioides sp. ZZV14-6045]MCC0732766.1 HIRAN domain-containing protein [Clostridioides sp. ZZV14-6048]MCC0740710.1 HIRAN domain-containing protein [Clostridioides sp. ZZV14-5902]MCC0740918.1 HIRAN domain-containing protein [Clostridioides sp. ZZV14-6044]MCC0752823.1 HIRAN domain-containing protein [Clostridioides sp. ZZV13-5731]WLD29069.1 HIRAN domain protein [Clostridioides dif
MGSIFKQLQKIKDYDGYKESFEMNYLCIYEKIPLREQVELANNLVENILNIYRSESNKIDVLEEYNHKSLICYFEIFMKKINTLIKERIIDEKWLYQLTKDLIYTSEKDEYVKLGLVLSENYLDVDNIREVVDTFSKSGEYIFYLSNTIRKLEFYNTYLFNLSRISTGSIKVFAIVNIENLDSKITSYLIEEGYKDKKYEGLLMNYIISTVDLSEYLERRDLDKDKVNNLAHLICNYLLSVEFKYIGNKVELVNQFLPIVTSYGTSFDSLYSIFLIAVGVLEDDKVSCDKVEFKKEMNNVLLSEKWKSVFFKALNEADGKIEDMIKMSKIYDVRLSFDDLLPYLNKDIRDFEVYWHISKKGSANCKLKLLDFFEKTFKTEELIGKMEDIEKNKLTQEYYDDMLFFIVLKGSKSLYPEGKNLSLKGIFGNINEVRKESINILKRYRERLSLKEMQIVKEAYEKEKNIKLKDELRRLLYESNNLKKEFVNTKKLKVNEHGKDIYLTSVAVAGSRFRNREYLEKELEKSKIYYLNREKDNLYDENAIRIVGETGYVIGYVPRKDNYILSNLLDGGKLLYCRVTEYNLDEDYIYINIYLSYKDVIETVENSLKMVLDRGKVKIVN